MRAYLIAMGLILFQLSIPIAAAIGITGGVAGETIGTLRRDISITDWKSLVLSVTGISLGIASLIFRLPVGAAVFAIVFAISSLPFSSTLTSMQELGYLVPSMVTLMTTVMMFVFIFGFIQLASAGGKGGY